MIYMYTHIDMTNPNFFNEFQGAHILRVHARANYNLSRQCVCEQIISNITLRMREYLDQAAKQSPHRKPHTRLCIRLVP